MKKDKQDNVLADGICELIASSVLPTLPVDDVAARIKERLMTRVHLNTHTFVFADQGNWKEIASGISIKLLNKDEHGKSFLVKMGADTALAAHHHEQDEESLVMEGEVWLEGVLCHAGDYHIARAGGSHQEIHTSKGCLLFVRGA